MEKRETHDQGIRQVLQLAKTAQNFWIEQSFYCYKNKVITTKVSWSSSRTFLIVKRYRYKPRSFHFSVIYPGREIYDQLDGYFENNRECLPYRFTRFILKFCSGVLHSLLCICYSGYFVFFARSYSPLYSLCSVKIWYLSPLESSYNACN